MGSEMCIRDRKLRGKLNNFSTKLGNIFSVFLPTILIIPAVLEMDTFLNEFIILVALIAGVIRVAVIGGADMPVVIAFLNSLSGIAAMSAGFIVNSIILIVAGALVGASGIILTLLMCAAMNRTLIDVLKGGFGTTTTNNEYDKDPISTSPEDVAIQLSYAESVVIVPGYGMAVAQAQSAVKELTNTLKDKNIEVKVFFNQKNLVDTFIAKGSVKNFGAKLIEDVNINNTKFSFFADNTDILIKNILVFKGVACISRKNYTKTKDNFNKNRFHKSYS